MPFGKCILIFDFTYNIFFLAMKELIIMPNNHTKLLDVDNVVCVFVTLSLSHTPSDRRKKGRERYGMLEDWCRNSERKG